MLGHLLQHLPSFLAVEVDVGQIKLNQRSQRTANQQMAWS
jgi:hypothetical protein